MQTGGPMVSANESTPIASNESLDIICLKFPPMVQSRGILNDVKPLKYSLPTLELQIIMMLALSHLLHFPLKRYGVSMIFSEILAGIILGTSGFGQLKEQQSTIFSFESQVLIGPLSVFGYMLFIFLCGVKMDVGMIKIKKSGGRAWVIALLVVAVPIFFGVALAYIVLGSPPDEKLFGNFTLIVANLAVSPFPVVACLLQDLKLLNSELGRLALSSSLISEIFSILHRAVAFLVSTSDSHSPGRAMGDLGFLVSLVLAVIFVIHPGLVWITKRTPEGRPVKDHYVYFVFFLVLVAAIWSHIAEQSAILGPFLIGLAVPAGPPLGSALVDKIESFASGLLLPVFVSLCSMRTNIWEVNLQTVTAYFTFKIMFVNFLSKFLATLLPALYCQMPSKDAFALAFIMTSRGIVDIGSYSFLRDSGVLDIQSFTMLALITAFNSAVFPIIVRLLYDPRRKYAGYHRRNIMHSNHQGKLPILVCIHKPENISATIKLLEASNPSPESPITVNVLHLLELRGRDSPIFISHQLQKKMVSDFPYSESVIVAFSKFQRNNWGAVSLQAFTAISPRKYMYEDICTLALDTLASIIIIPFHRQWAIDGTVDSDDLALRALNRSVIDHAPCSIGILVDRGKLSHSISTGKSTTKTYHVGMIFLSGNDDQEALTYAKRMIKDSSVSLTVVNLVSATGENDSISDKERLGDLEILNDIKLNNNGDSIKYVEQVVNGGPDTSTVAQTMVNEYDLIIVGRRKHVESPQTSGLDEEWSEFPELGIMGDLLASSDLKGKASVLVVQQQQIS